MLELNKIHNTDCLEFMRSMPDRCVDLVVTDPPYLIDYKSGYRKDKTHDFASTIQNDDNPDLIRGYIKECYRIMKQNTAMYMFCCQNKNDFFKQELEKYFNIKNQIIWVKNNHTVGDLTSQFGKAYEIIFLVNKGEAPFVGKRLTDVWYYDRIVGNKQKHQNQKPINLIKQCLLKHSLDGDIVFDGFMGSGTTAVACKELNRNFIGCEIETKYCEIAEKRLRKAVRSLF